MVDFPLTTAARVKQRLGTKFEASATSDPVLASLIESVSMAAGDRFMRRGVESKIRTEYTELDERQEEVRTFGAPWDVAKTTPAVRISTKRSTLDTAAALDPSSYDFDPLRGVLFIGHNFHLRGRRFLRLDYQGGMAADTDAFVLAFPDIASAIDEQVLYEFQQKASPGRSVNIRQGSIQVDPAVDWLPKVRRTLSGYRREPRL